jgi:hypothetical protein
MSVAPSVADLLKPPAADELEAFLLAYLQIAANPVTDWESGAVQRTMLHIDTAILSSLLGPGTPPAVQSALAGLLANGYIDTGAGKSLETLAHGWYAVEKDDGSFAVQTVTLACDAAHGPYTFTAGLQEGLASDKTRYVVAGSGTLPGGATLTLDFNARSVGLAKALITGLAEALPGVTVQESHIKVAGGVPQFGADPDTDQAVKDACAARFPDPAVVDLRDRVEKWALSAGTSCTRVRPDPDPVLAGGVLLTVANAAGPLAGGEVTTIANYIRARLGITDNVTVQNAAAANVTPGGKVTAPAALIPAIQAAANAAWVAYLSSSNIGGEVFLLPLIQAVMDAGATNFEDPTLNGAGEDLFLAANEVPVPVGTLATELDWVPV